MARSASSALDRARERVRAGSRASTVVETIAGLTARLGRGAEIREIREAFEGEHGGVDARIFTAEVSSLRRRGVLETTGGRSGRSLYALAGSGLKGRQSDEDDAMLVLEAVRSGYRRLRRALSTREVAEEIARRGRPLSTDHPNAVRKYLETLSKARGRGPEAFRAPKVVRVASEAASGRPSAHWAPAAAPDAVAVAPRSRADAVRTAVATASQEVGRPVSLAELRWWLSTPGAEAVHGGMLMAERLGDAVANAARQDARAGGDVGRIASVRTWWTCHGGPPVRYGLGEPTEEACYSCEFDDLLDLLHPADEMALIRGLLRRAESFQSPVLRTLAGIRSDLLAGLFSDWAEDAPRREAVIVSAKAWRAAGEWYRRSPSLTEGQRETRRQAFRRWQAQHEAALRLWSGPTVDRPRIMSVGLAAAVPLSDLAPVLDAAGTWLGIEGAQARQRLVVSARRAPLRESAVAGRFGAADDLPLSVVDRVDALMAVWELLPLPRASALRSMAIGVLGHVLRDACLLHALLERVPRGEPYSRHALVVALGLLGEPVDPDLGMPDRAAHDDAAAWVLSTVLADWGGAPARVTQADLNADGAARRVFDTALMRMGTGNCFAVVG